MSASQRRLLEKVATPIFDAIPELSPRIIAPSKDKQKSLAIADSTLLFQVGAYRAISIYPVDRETWNAKEFDSESGDLRLLREKTSAVAQADVPVWVLAASISSIDDQLAAYKATGYPSPAHEASAATLGRQLAVLRQRLNSRTRQAAIVGSDDDDFDYLG